ncbi:MAG: hypothetical protein ACP5IF_07820, partial [Conexivisphaera sp.]
MRIADGVSLGNFWLSMIRKYGRGVLDGEQIRWIVGAKDKGELTNREIADAQGISVRRVQQLYSEYRRSGSVPEPRRAGRPGKGIAEGERETVIECTGGTGSALPTSGGFS